eukprot:Partr_v1_DN28885_c2_g1_i2_m33036 putative Conserved hypothetical protein
MCCQKAKWKRERVLDHRFDYINMDYYASNSKLLKWKFAWLILLTIRVFISLITDILAVTFLFLNGPDRPGSVFKNVEPRVLLLIAPYVYLACLLASALIFLFDLAKANRIVRSRLISFAFTNTIAYRYYCFSKYSYFCFFQKIHEMKRTSDQTALFVFFRLKNWKRIVFAEAPRHIINIIAIASYFRHNGTDRLGEVTDSMVKNLSLFFMTLAATIFVISALSMIVAMITYVPLLCEIRGNLKEYCCHKIDKRIGQLVLQSSKRQMEQQQQHYNRSLPNLTKVHLLHKTPPPPPVISMQRLPPRAQQQQRRRSEDAIEFPSSSRQSVGALSSRSDPQITMLQTRPRQNQEQRLPRIQELQHPRSTNNLRPPQQQLHYQQQPDALYYFQNSRKPSTVRNHYQTGSRSAPTSPETRPRS